MPWIFNLRLIIAGNTGKKTGQNSAPSPRFPGLFPFQEIVESPASVSGILFPQIHDLFRADVFPFFCSQLLRPLLVFLPSFPEGEHCYQAEEKEREGCLGDSREGPGSCIC